MAASSFNVGDVEGQIKGLSDQISTLGTAVSAIGMKCAIPGYGESTGRYYYFNFTATGRVPVIVAMGNQTNNADTIRVESVVLNSDGNIATKTGYITRESAGRVKIDAGATAWCRPFVVYPSDMVTITV